MSGISLTTALLWLLATTSGVCMSPQPTAKQANELAGFRQAGLTKDHSQVPALLAALKNPPERFYTFNALHTLAQIGATEALPAVNSLLATSHDIDLVNYAVAAKARILAESGAQAVKDPKARARAKLAALYQGTSLTPEALNGAAKVYQVYASTPGEPTPIGVYVMREAADILYQEGVASSMVETTPPDYLLDPASALKVRLAPLSHQNRVTTIIDELASDKVKPGEYRYELQLIGDENMKASRIIGNQLAIMDAHPEEYTSAGFANLFEASRGIGDKGQAALLKHFMDDEPERGHTAGAAYLDADKGIQRQFAIGY